MCHWELKLGLKLALVWATGKSHWESHWTESLEGEFRRRAKSWAESVDGEPFFFFFFLLHLMFI